MIWHFDAFSAYIFLILVIYLGLFDAISACTILILALRFGLFDPFSDFGHIFLAYLQLNVFRHVDFNTSKRYLG